MPGFTVVVESRIPKKLGELLKQKRKNLIPCVVVFGIFAGILCYSTNVLSGVAKLWNNFQTSPETRRAGSIQDLEESCSDADEPLKCNLPKLNPFDPAILEFIKAPPDIDCDAAMDDSLNFRTNFESNLIQIGNLEKLNCCYRTSQSPQRGKSDSEMRFSKLCHPIRDRISKISPLHEFIQVQCQFLPTQHPGNQSYPTRSTALQNFTDYFAFVPVKPSAESRIRNYLKQTKNLVGDKLSVLILGLDAQSRMNFIRQMPSSYNYIMKNLSAIELRGYTKVGDNTFPNVVPLLTGLNITELAATCWPTKNTYFDKCPFIWKDFAERGYRTSYAEDSVWMGTFNYDKKGFLDQPTDYYLNPLTYQMSKQIGHEIWGNSKLCYGSRLSFEILLDYITKTSVTFSGKQKASAPLPYFQFVWANSLFHDYLNHPRLGDELFTQTLEFLVSNNFLNKAVFILLSDHGMRWGSIRSTYQGKLEERMPMAYFVFPPWFLRDQKYAFALKRLRDNADRLTTPFDIHETLIDILNLSREGGSGSNRNAASIIDKTQILHREQGLAHARELDLRVRGQSLFLRVPKARTCRTAEIEEHWCTCYTMQSIPKSLSIVNMAANYIVEAVNTIVTNHTQCAKLKLKKINSVLRKIDGDFDSGVSDLLSGNGTDPLLNVIPTDQSQSGSTTTTGSPAVQLQLTLVTGPGDAVFEATVYGTPSEWHLSGEISRLNLYRSSSYCVKDQIVQKYCLCDADTED